jgi:N-acetylglucosamine kinase-like BadF-type ATPase
MAAQVRGLGIDAGGSATRWALCDASGVIVGTGEVPAASGHLYGPEERARFERMAAALRDAVGAAEVGRIVAGVTGIAAATPEAALAASILARSLGIDEQRARIDDDMWIAYHAAFKPGEGHLVYCGTGSIGVHIAADGSVVRVGGRGMLIDDAGSAFWIGRKALELIWRRIDADPEAGREGRLAAEIFAAIGDNTWDAVRTYVYGGGRNAVAALAQAVARADDDDARAILGLAGKELARLACALMQRVGARPVALAGRAAHLHPLIFEGFRAGAPEVDVRLVSIDAAAAAARLAVAACGARATGAG